MARKLFKSKVCQDFFYEVMWEYWLDDDTYVMGCQDMIDVDGDEYHLEVEYDSAYITKSFPLELKLEVGLDVTIDELSNWLNNLSVDVKSASSDDRIRLVSSKLYN